MANVQVITAKEILMSTAVNKKKNQKSFCLNHCLLIGSLQVSHVHVMFDEQ